MIPKSQDGSAMNENPSPEKQSPRSTLLKNSFALLALFVLAVIGYSIYVAIHEPDPQETVILGQRTLASASPAGLRILVRHRVSHAPVRNAEVVLSLSAKSTAPVKLGSFRTDHDGSISDAVNIPELAPGEYQLRVDVASTLGRDHIVRSVDVQHPTRILLSSDKPLYQPGQTIHLRTLVSNARTQKPLTNDSVTFEIADPKGNKVFKETRPLSAFGIASADFVLASELNLGPYEIRALAGPAATERTVEVKRYVLPKFKINIATDKPYYLPGQTVSGSVQAGCFFGKPVGDASVKLSASTLTIPEMQSRTDANGKYLFRFVLPEHFVGLPQHNEQALLDLTAEITDGGGHTEQKTLPLPISQNELELTAIPEAGTIIPGVENLVYVLTTYPDGRPAICKVFVDGTAWQSDSQGVSVIKLLPGDVGRKIDFQAIDDSGRKAKILFNTQYKDASSVPLLVRTDKAVYQAGQTAQITLLLPEGNNTVFIDAIKEGQTVMTKSVPLKNHKAQYSLSLPPSLAGAVTINAYMITEAGEDRGRTRLIYVNPATSLRINAHAGKQIYRPGEVAKIEFNVLDAQGHPAPSALGISAVDESVFALSENRPGLLQQFLEAEADLMKPRYQIKSFCDPGQIFGSASVNQGLAQAYLASWSEAPEASNIDNPPNEDYGMARVLAHIRSLRGTPEYESLRNDPQYSALLRQVEGEDKGRYTLRQSTGPIKLRAVESRRRAYFNSLEHWLQAAFGIAIFLLPIGLIIYYQSPHAIIRLETSAGEQQAHYAAVASSAYNLLAALTLGPLVFYPVGLFFIGAIYNEGKAAYLLLIFETAVVLLTLGIRFFSFSKPKPAGMEAGMSYIQSTFIIFLLQFFISRVGIIVIAVVPSLEQSGFIMLWILASLAAPLFVLGGFGSHIRSEFAARGIPAKFARSSVMEVLITIAIMMCLAGLLLPALAKAKAKSGRINLMGDLKQVDLANRMAEEDAPKTDPSANASSSPRIRRDFPETLLWRPELITDDQGKATLEIPLADSITTWRASVDAVNAAGKMGSTELPITVFQDFFIDLDLPVSMSLDDEVSVPVVCYNYLRTPQDLRLQLAPAKWFESTGQTLTVSLNANEVKGVSFPIKVRQVGSHVLRVTAQGAKISDAIERQIRVLPVGRQIEHTQNDSLKESFADTFAVPADAIPGSESCQLKFYPSRFSEVVEGLDSIFRAPYGCFEQTSSTTYPNVLVLEYMKRTGRLTPDIEVTARKYINAGYQRLLTFEVPGGGFEWFGRTPANICLTAYGVLEFTDMAKVHPVDEAVTDRARKWLFAQQNGNGSWDEIHRGWTWAGRGSMTAFVAWALAESGDQSEGLDKALNYLRSHPDELAKTYAKALAANAFLARDHGDGFGHELAAQLQKEAILDSDKSIHWSSQGYSITYSHASGMDAEVTALATMALMKAGQSPQSVKQGLTWISSHKFADGTLGSTQATILAMRALLAGSGQSLGQEFESTITLMLNGEKVETCRINKDNSDVMQQFDLTKHLHTGENRLELRQSPAGELPFQLTGSYWLPARADAHDTAIASSTVPMNKAEPLQIDVRYDRTSLAVNDQILCAVTVRNNTGQGINMAMVDLGLPPGFDVDPSSFESMQQAGQIAKFEITGNQVILYLRELSETVPMKINYSLHAKYPLHVQTPPSIVYEYYQPQNRAQSKPVTLRVSVQ